MPVNNLEIAALGIGSGLVGAGVKAGYNRFKKAVISSDEMPIKEIATTTQAADAIAKAAGAVVTMLQGELNSKAEYLDRVNRQLETMSVALTDLKDTETKCQARLLFVENQLGLKDAPG